LLQSIIHPIKKNIFEQNAIIRMASLKQSCHAKAGIGIYLKIHTAIGKHIHALRNIVIPQ
jgi:hypothetical protein